MLPLLRLAAKREHSNKTPNVGIMNISSKTASLEDNGMGKLYGSRLSKVKNCVLILFIISAKYNYFDSQTTCTLNFFC